MTNELFIKSFLFIVIILSAVFHEWAHGWIAWKLGDDTAKNSGRLTLNPIPHIDLFGTILLPIFLLFTSGIFIGWAKPVPYNPFNLRDKRHGVLKVALAGPVMNFILAVIFGLLSRFSVNFGFSVNFASLCGLASYINIFLALFNLIPIPPLDGSKILVGIWNKYAGFMYGFGFLGIIVSLLLAFYFIPPIAQFIFYIIVGSKLFF